MIYKNPYSFTSDELLFDLHIQRNSIPDSELTAARKQFFSKGQACLRSSPLPKRYGWGFHFNEEGKIAICSAGSAEYEFLADDPNLTQLKAMRSSKKSSPANN